MKLASFHRISYLLLALCLAAPAALAIPIVSPGVNSASLMPPGLPQYGVAQGSLFVVFGVDMGPAVLVSAAAFPLTTDLAGTSVQVTVGGVTVDCLLVYTSAGQLAAVLPSNTPLGEGTITVTFNGETSDPSPILVVAQTIGIFGTRADGRGPAIVTDLTFTVNSVINSFVPGQIVVAWITGLGARTSDAQPMTQDLQGTLELHVVVGGKQATVFYAGPSGFGGVDQVNFEIPPDVIEGCFVPFVMWAGETRSNYTSISISSQGTTCSDSQGFLADEIDQLNQQGALTVGTVLLSAVFLSAEPVGGAGALGTAKGIGQAPLAFAAAAFTNTNAFQHSRVGIPFPQDVCASFWALADFLDNPFAPVQLPAAGDIDVRFPSGDATTTLDLAGNPVVPLTLPDPLNDFYEVDDQEGNLIVDGQAVTVPARFQRNAVLLTGAVDENFAAPASVDAWFDAWGDYHSNGGQPPLTLNLEAPANVPPNTVLELSGQANFNSPIGQSLVAGYSCNFDLQPGPAEYSIPMEVMANMPSVGPLTGMQSIRWFPVAPTRRPPDNGTVDVWMTFDQVVWQREFTAPPLNLSATATEDQVVPPTGAQTQANCTFAANENGVSGICTHNLAPTGLSMNLGAPGENGDRFFFTEAGPGNRIDFGFTAGELPAETPIGALLDALRNGQTYVLLHSEAFPGGEVRGQIELDVP